MRPCMFKPVRCNDQIFEVPYIESEDDFLAGSPKTRGLYCDAFDDLAWPFKKDETLFSIGHPTTIPP